ncbi:uncharacterized protein LOC120341795 [Styela clava]
MTKVTWALLFVFVMLFATHCEGKKKTDYSKHVQKVDNIKDFKKILRTRINVLVLFSSSGSAANSVMDVFGEAAIASKGTATLIEVDCSTKEGKKLCKKQKAKPDPTVIQHYKDGEYSADYDRKFSVKSILAFLRDPTSDGPWEEEDSAQDVVHLHNENEVNKLLKKKKPTLIMFYAPWCGFCKRFKPAYSEAATDMKNKVIFAGVDADSPEASSLRQTYNVTGFPKTIYFENGKQKFDYSGGHQKSDIVEWLADPQPQKEKEPEKGWDETENDVVHLTDTTFDEFIAANSKVMVFFYAPWCGHCKTLKPHWDKAAETLAKEEAPEKLTAVDATKFNDLASKYKVKGYPTVIYFENGEEKYDASGAFTRTPEGIVQYIKDPKEPPPPEKEWHETESDVQHLTDEDFKSATKKKKHSLIMFYAPWCGHCKKAKPEYTNAAATFADDKKVMFAAVDCTKHKKTCEQYSVQGYPTFYYLSYGKSETKYQGGRETLDFENFVEDVLQNPDIVDEDEDDSPDFWDNIPGSDLLHKLTETSWETFVAEYSKAILVIYDSKCPNCEALRKPLGECARQLKKGQMKVEIGVVEQDLSDEDIPHLWSVDMGVPTIFWFANGQRQVEYEGVRSMEGIMKFISEEIEAQGPEWSMQESSEDIIHLNDEIFEEFLREHEESLVYFYSPGCKACNQIKPKYEEAATLLDELKPEVALGAVNVRKALTLKKKYEIDSLPKFLYFKHEKLKFEYHGQQTAEALVDFMLKPSFIPKPKVDDEWFGEETNVTLLDKNTLSEFISKHNNVLVMFYAPWCGHCKQFKPAFKKAANILATKTTDAKLAAFNGNNNNKINSKYDVKGFPTLVYFMNHEYVSHYKGKRIANAVVDFMIGSTSEDQQTKPVEIDIINSTRPYEVEFLDPENFQKYLDEHDNVMVMFYAPWCGSCKNSKTPYFEAAVDIYEDLEDSSMAIFDAYKHRKFADEFDVKGYPTLWYFSNGEKQYKYNGEITKEALTDFMADPHEIEGADTKHDPSSWIAEKDKVVHLNRDNFDKTLKQHKTAIVFFYINACQYCIDTVKPKYVEAAEVLANESPDVLLVAINGDWEKSITSKLNVNSFPTFLYFMNGKMQYKYEGPYDSASLVMFLKKPSKELAKRRKPTSWQDLPSANYGNVEHLDNHTYDAFLKEHPIAMIMFHSPWYSRCLGLREVFREASENLSSEIGMGAIDCHRKPEQGIICYKLKIKEFPSFKYFKNGELQRSFDGMTANDFIIFLQAEKDGTPHDEL